MYDILVYLFENCQQYEVSNEKERVAKKLSAAASMIRTSARRSPGWRAWRAAPPLARAAARHGAAFRAYAPKDLPSSTPNAAAC
jgi:hypothetical protein